MNGRVDIADFPPEARALLARLSAGNIRSLAIQASADTDSAAEAAWPADPVDGTRAALGALTRKASADVDDGLHEIACSLRLAVLILSYEEEIDGPDAAALAWLLSRAEGLLSQEVGFHLEARRRLALIKRGAQP